MKKKKTGKILPLVILCVLIAAMFIAYKAAQSSQKNAEDTSADTGNDVIMLIDRTSAEVASIAYQIGNGDAYAFRRDAQTGAWVYDAEPHFPINQTTVGTMAAAICRIGAYRHLEEGDTGVYGFAAPALEIAVVYTDGAVHRYQIGDVNPMSGQRYFKDVDTGAVYTIAAALYDYFDYTLDALFVYDILPSEIEAANITSFALAGCTVTDASVIAQMYELYTALAPKVYADIYADEAELSAYGIGEKVLTVSYQKTVELADGSGTARIPATFEIFFGGTDADGRVYYQLSTSDIIYLAEAETVSALFGAIAPVN